MYRVRLYQFANGESPIRKFMDSSQKSLRSKIIRQLRYLEEFGMSPSNPNLKKITGTNLWEIRILGKDNIRIICVALINEQILILHIFVKKSEKTRSRDINLALKRYKGLTTDI